MCDVLVMSTQGPELVQLQVSQRQHASELLLVGAPGLRDRLQLLEEAFRSLCVGGSLGEVLLEGADVVAGTVKDHGLGLELRLQRGKLRVLVADLRPELQQFAILCLAPVPKLCDVAGFLMASSSIEAAGPKATVGPVRAIHGQLIDHALRQVVPAQAGGQCRLSIERAPPSAAQGLLEALPAKRAVAGISVAGDGVIEDLPADWAEKVLGDCGAINEKLDGQTHRGKVMKCD